MKLKGKSSKPKRKRHGSVFFLYYVFNALQLIRYIFNVNLLSQIVLFILMDEHIFYVILCFLLKLLSSRIVRLFGFFPCKF